MVHGLYDLVGTAKGNAVAVAVQADNGGSSPGHPAASPLLG